MRLPSHHTLALALTMTVLWFPQPAWAQSSPDYVPGEILVKWERALTGLSKAMARDYVAGLTVREFSEIGWEHIEIDPTMDVQTAIQKILQQPGVIAAEPNYILHGFATVPDDFRFDLQWALQNTGQTVDGIAGTAGADISATTAWDLRTTSPNVVVAVLDSGITLNHSDLSANLWVNPGETAGNGIDDDGNGKIDDVNGWDFVNGDNNPTDDETNLHGTHVSGIVGAKGNDGSGIAGITWTVQLMSLKILDASNSGTTADAISAGQYAQAEGAQIINASFGGPNFSQAAKDAIDAFSGLFVASAGNDGTDNDVTPVYPACFTSTNIVAVAATDQNDALASFSNFGTTCVDLAAPGVNIFSDNSVGFVSVLDGTSFSAPMVSGVAALLKAQEPNRSTAEIRSAILDNVDAKASLSGKVATGGRLNARAALAALAPLAPSGLAGTAAGATQVDLTWTDNSAGETGYEVQRKTGSGSFTTLANLAANSTSHADTTTTELTTHTYRVRASNSGTNSGFSSEVSVTTPPAAPTGLTATADSTSAITLTWTDNSAGETGYEIQRKSGGGAFAAVTTTAANGTSHTDSGLAAGTTFTYQVRATGTGGNSSFSAEASATTQGGGGGGGGGGCFIATAAYGSPLAAEVQVLREFRDRALLKHARGRFLVSAYYRLSPPLAGVIAENEALRAATRGALWPVIWGAELALTSPGLAWTVLVLGAGGLVISVTAPFVVWRARRARKSSP
ncbi:MAG: S8 family serine peptidase [Chloroflexi bacterium]|nr:S8 family serine peptidase [Chloroflexota bacterium]